MSSNASRGVTFYPCPFTATTSCAVGLERICVDPNICDGKPCIRGTRIVISIVLDNLAAGESVDAIVASYASLKREDVMAALAYAAELADERAVYIPRSG